MSTRAAAVLGAAVLIVLAGCTAVVDGVASPVGGSGPTAVAPSSTFQPSLAPPVPQPRDVRGVGGCDLITAEQKTELGIDLASEEFTFEGDPSGCAWVTLDGEGALAASGVQEPPAGLEGLYLLRDTFELFEPGEIDGFPVVRVGLVDTPDSCRYYIGVADDQMLLVQAVYPFVESMACPVVRRLASAVIANLPPPG